MSFDRSSEKGDRQSDFQMVRSVADERFRSTPGIEAGIFCEARPQEYALHMAAGAIGAATWSF